MADQPTVDDVRTAVQVGVLAPSVHNSQPWRFRWDGTSLQLREERERSLPVLDPSGRERVLSCGAALLGTRIGFAGLGWDTSVRLLPDGGDDALLAVLEVTGRREPTSEDADLVAAAARRGTDRDPYDARPVPDDVLTALRRAAEQEGAFLHAVTRQEDLVELEVLLAHADTAQRRDPEYLEELQRWRTTDGDVGVPTRALPTVPASQRGDSLSLRDFDAGRTDRPAAVAAEPSGDPPVPEHPTVLVIGPAEDGRRDWLVAGQALGRVLLHATVATVATQPVTSVLETQRLRDQLARHLSLLGSPQMVLRAGYGTAGPVTHRLPLDQVLELS